MEDERGRGALEGQLLRARLRGMARRKNTAAAPPAGRPSALLDTRVIYCGDCLDQLQKLPDGCADLLYIDPPESSNRNYELFRDALSEPRAQASGPPSRFEDRHASTAAYIDYMPPRCVELARVPENHGRLYDRQN